MAHEGQRDCCEELKGWLKEKDLREQVLLGKSEVIELGYLYYFNMNLSQFASGQGAREIGARSLESLLFHPVQCGCSDCNLGQRLAQIERR